MFAIKNSRASERLTYLKSPRGRFRNSSAVTDSCLSQNNWKMLKVHQRKIKLQIQQIGGLGLEKLLVSCLVCTDSRWFALNDFIADLRGKLIKPTKDACAIKYVGKLVRNFHFSQASTCIKIEQLRAPHLPSICKHPQCILRTKTLLLT